MTTGPDHIAVAISIAMRKLSHVECKGEDVRRDMELIREILRAIIAKEDLDAREITISGHDEQIVARHIEMLYRAGYIDGTVFGGGRRPRVLVIDLSWEGHEFAGALLTDESVWAKVKEAFGPEKLATVPLKMIESVAMQAITAWGLKQMGLE